jgi:hypothetical protein
MAKTKITSALPQSAETTANGFTDMSTVFERNGAAIAAAIKAGEAMFDGMAEFNREVMSFASDRLRKSWQTSDALLGCHDPAEAFTLQYEHARGATQAYAEEATRIMALAAKMSDQCLHSMETQVRDGADRAS